MYVCNWLLNMIFKFLFYEYYEKNIFIRAPSTFLVYLFCQRVLLGVPCGHVEEGGHLRVRVRDGVRDEAAALHTNLHSRQKILCTNSGGGI